MAETGLTTGDFTEEAEPYRLFAKWLEDATASEPNDPNALALATVDSDGLPDVRMVLLKGFDERGFVFYTNFESAKGREILSSMKAAMCFHWKSLRRQVRIRGPVEQVSDAEADRVLCFPAARAASGPGPRSSLVRSKAVSRWKRPSPNTPPSTPSGRSRVRRTGPVLGSCRNPSSSGMTGRSGCMTVLSSRGRRMRGTRPGFIPERNAKP